MEKPFGNFGSVAFVKEDMLFVRVMRKNTNLKGADKLFYAELSTGGQNEKGPDCNLERDDEIFLQSPVDPETFLKESRIVSNNNLKIIAQGCIGCAAIDRCKLVGKIKPNA